MKVFLDTNVLVSAVISRGLCRDLFRIASEEHDVVVSQVVIDEFENVLREKFGATQPALEKALMLLDNAIVAANPTSTPAEGALEANDALIVAAARDAKADVLVTGDQAMLARTHGLPIDVVSPREFMERTRKPDSYPTPTDRDDSAVSEPTTNTIGEQAFEFALSIVKLCRVLEEQSHAVIVRRLLQAGTGIGANVEGTMDARSRHDFFRRMSAAYLDARQSNYWLRLLDRSGIAPEIDFTPHLENSARLIYLLNTILEDHTYNARPTVLEAVSIEDFTADP